MTAAHREPQAPGTSLEDCWRAVVLLGGNVACYKFALAKSLLELADEETTFVTLEELDSVSQCDLPPQSAPA